MSKISDFYREHEWLTPATFWFIVACLIGGCYAYKHFHPSPPEQVIKNSWNEYYEKKYFVAIYDQLKKSNRHSENGPLEEITNAIINDVENVYEVSELPHASKVILDSIAYANHEIDVGDEDHTYLVSAYTESLILNLDLNKPEPLLELLDSLNTAQSK